MSFFKKSLKGFRGPLPQTLRGQAPALTPSFRTQNEPLQSPPAESEASTTSTNKPRSQSPKNQNQLDILTLLSTPTWSIRTLLPPSPSNQSPSSPPTEEITPQTLSHLLRLSALPSPSSLLEEATMLKTLHSQLHFLKHIQAVNTEGVKPLQSLREETEQARRENTVGLESLRGVLEGEELKGRNKRARRRRVVEEGKKGGGDGVEWDVFAAAGETVVQGAGRYFVVRSGKE